MQQLFQLQSSFHLKNQNLPNKSGIYIFIDKNNDILYVGKAKNLKNRVSSYFVDRKLLDPKTTHMVSQIKKIKTIEVENEIESFLLEARYIKKLNPKYNIKLKDAKMYPMVKISIKDKFPKITVVRRYDDEKSMYFGPFPKVSELRAVLMMMRRIFPYVSVSNHPKKYCFYNHIGLCPCPQASETQESIKSYRNNIKHIAEFLNGKTNKIVKELEKERDGLSKKEEFEKARLVQQKIDAIKNIASPFRKPFEYETNPNLVDDLRNKEIEQLKKILNREGVNVEKLKKIECYDISNTSGILATASMVVFLNGEKNTSLYRKFKIKQKGPNDPAMMQEVLLRRLKHGEWEFPDLIIVDGGKSQVSFAKKSINENGFEIPVIGLAKRNETIITSDFKEINLPKDSNALHLLRRIRDEAHRFAISYHKKLRSKFIS